MAETFESKVQVVFEAMNRANAELERTRKQISAITAEVGGQRRATEPLIAANARLKAVLGEVNDSLAAQTGRLGMVGRMAAGAGGATAALVGVVVGLGVAAVASAKAIGDYQERLDIAADATGLSTRAVTALQVAASNVGREFEAIQPQLVYFSRRVGEAAEGNEELERRFRSLGIRIKDDVSGELRKMDDILSDTMDRLRATSTAAERNAVMFQLFGRGGATAYAILSQSMEENAAVAERTGLKLTASQEKAARAADVAGDRMANAWKGLRNQVTASLAPAGTAIMNWATSAIENLKKVGDFIDEHTLGAFRRLGEVQKEGASAGAGGTPTVSVGPVRALRSPAHEELGKVVKQAKEQLHTLQNMIPLLDYQRSIGAITADQEAEKLAAMKSQALTAREILIIEQKVAELKRIAGTVPGARPDAVPFGPRPDPSMPRGGWREDLFFRPSSRGEMAEGDMTLPSPDAVTEFLSQFEDFESLIEQASGGTGEANDAMIGFVGTMRQTKTSALEVGIEIANTFRHTIRGGVEDFLSNAMDGVGKLDKAFGEMIQSIVKQMIVKIGTSVILGAIGLQGGGRLVGLQGGGRLAFAAGAVRPILAQTGVMMAGTRGIDSQIIAMGRGEGVFSNAVMDKLDRFLNVVLRPAPREAARPVAADGRRNVSVALNFPNMITGDRKALRQAAEDDVASVVARVESTRSMRRF